MPYKNVGQLPDQVRSVLEREGQEVWRQAYNGAFTGDDAAASKAAWAAVERAGFKPRSGQGWSKYGVTHEVQSARLSEGAGWAEMNITPFYGGPGSVEVPRNFVTSVAGRILSARAEARDGSRRNFSASLRSAMDDDEFLTQLYTGAPACGVRFFLIGEGAQAALDELLSGE